ncbi:hypothetical protein [Fervidobacterium thailandense]|nr:hypothetical protein [Fervidobacterium thailandense]
MKLVITLSELFELILVLVLVGVVLSVTVREAIKRKKSKNGL